MYTKLSEQNYQWIGEDGGHKTGKRMELDNGEPLTKLVDMDVCWDMRHSCDRKPELVPIDNISLYPSEPIPQP